MLISSSHFVLLGVILVDIEFLPFILSMWLKWVVDLAGFGGAWLWGFVWLALAGLGFGDLSGWLWWGLALGVCLAGFGVARLALVVCLVGLGCGPGWLALVVGVGGVPAWLYIFIVYKYKCINCITHASTSASTSTSTFSLEKKHPHQHHGQHHVRVTLKGYRFARMCTTNNG